MATSLWPHFLAHSLVKRWKQFFADDLFDEIDAGLKIHAEVDELPLDAFLLVLLLLEDEHVVVEELLQTLVGVVDAQLLERVVLRQHISTA